MVPIEELKGIVLCQHLTDPMLEKLGAITEQVLFQDKEVVFKQGEVADYFYMLKRGKVLLEVEITPAVTIITGAIKPGYSFGWSALTDQPRYRSHAVCAELCEVLRVPAKEFMALLDADHTMGYLVMQSVARITRKRLDLRTAQFVKVIAKHPEIEKLIDGTTS